MQNGVTSANGASAAPDPAADALAQFQALVLLRNRARPHFGKLPNPSHYAVGANPLCGDHLIAELVVVDAKIKQCSFYGEMSAISVAAAEILCAQIENLSLCDAEHRLRAAQAMLAGQQDLVESDEFHCFAVVRRYPSRLKTATLPVATLLAAIRGDSAQVSTE
jgi:nitrogen fixation NifU-like protein